MNDEVSWWLGKVISSTTLSDVAPFALASAPDHPLYQVPQLTGEGSWSARAAAPSCPSITPSQDAKAQSTTFNWYSAAEQQGGSNRQAAKPGREAQRDRGGRDVLHLRPVWQHRDEDQQCPRHRDRFAIFRVCTDGSARDDVSVHRGWLSCATHVTNALGHQSSTVTDNATGLVLSSQPIQGAPTTTYVYDIPRPP